MLGAALTNLPLPSRFLLTPRLRAAGVPCAKAGSAEAPFPTAAPASSADGWGPPAEVLPELALLLPVPFWSLRRATLPVALTCLSVEMSPCSRAICSTSLCFCLTTFGFLLACE